MKLGRSLALPEGNHAGIFGRSLVTTEEKLGGSLALPKNQDGIENVAEEPDGIRGQNSSSGGQV
jgi:hypothetical protein